MERIVAINCAVLCISILLFEAVSSSPHDNSLQQNVASRRSNLGKTTESHLWFGPRLGRKRRNPNNNDFEEIRHKENMAQLMDVTRYTPWAILALNEGKRHVVNFTPRLGRESGEDLMDSKSDESQWLQDPIWSEEVLSQRSPPFAPRLGRHLSSYYSRLERENDKMSFA